MDNKVVGEKKIHPKIAEIMKQIRQDIWFWLFIVLVWGSLIWMVGGALLGYDTNPCTQQEPCERPGP